MNKEKLALYLSIAGAATSGLAKAQVEYFDFDPDLELQGNLEFINIDVDRDSIDDFVLITEDTLVAAISGSYDVGRVRGGGYFNLENDFVGSQPGSYDYVSMLEMMDAIGPSQNFLNGGTFAMAIDGANPFNEPWNGGAVDKYLGFRFEIGDSTHFGWMRLDISADAKSVIVKDLAYSLRADYPIAAGAMSLSSKEWSISSYLKLTKDEIWIAIPEGKGKATLNVLDAKGAHILKQELEEGDTRLQAPQEVGVYSIELHCDGQVFRQKWLRRPE